MEKPYLYWAGNKYYAMEQMLPYIGSGDLFVELFVGSGAVFINTDFKNYELYDINQDLIDLHWCVQQYEYFPQMAIGMLEQVMNNETDYYNIRKIFNESRGDDMVYRSMLLLYLNRVCFHGVMQYSKRKGEFNSPFGWRDKISIDVDKMKYFRQKSRDAQFICADYKKVDYTSYPSGTVVYCLAPGSKVRMLDESFKNIENVAFGDKLFGDKYVKQTFVRQYSDTMLEIELQSLPDNIKVTKDHLVYRISKINNRQETRTNDELWMNREIVRADQLEHGDYFLVPLGGFEKTIDWIKPNCNSTAVQGHRKLVDFNPGKALFRLLGYYAAEGHIQYSNKRIPSATIFSFGNDKKQEQLNDCIECIKTVFGIDPVIKRKAPHDTVDQIHIHSAAIAEFFSYYVHGTAIDKYLHQDLITANIELQKEMLITWLRSDGGYYIGTRNRFKLTGTSSSEIMARQFYQIGLRCGLRPSYKTRSSKNYRDKNKTSVAYDVYFCAEDAYLLGWDVPSKQFRTTRRIIKNHMLVRITDIKSYQYDGLVYDIDVNDDNLFCVNYVLTHNCDPPYLASSKTAKFTGYTPAGFTIQDHINLNQLGVNLRQRGTKMIISSAYTEEAREIYKDGCPVEIIVPAKVSRYKGYNGKRQEYLFVYEP